MNRVGAVVGPNFVVLTKSMTGALALIEK